MVGVPGSARPPQEVYFSRVLLVRSRNPALHIFLAPSSFWSFPVEEKIPVEYRGWEFSAFWGGSAHLPTFPTAGMHPCAPRLLCTPVLKYPTQLLLAQIPLLFLQNLDFKSASFPTAEFPFLAFSSARCLPRTVTIQR